MIKKIRLMLEYNTYCVWLYDENDEIISAAVEIIAKKNNGKYIIQNDIKYDF